MDGFRDRRAQCIFPEFRGTGSGVGPKYCNHLFGGTPANAQEYGFRDQSARGGGPGLLKGICLGLRQRHALARLASCPETELLIWPNRQMKVGFRGAGSLLTPGGFRMLLQSDVEGLFFGREIDLPNCLPVPVVSLS